MRFTQGQLFSHKGYTVHNINVQAGIPAVYLLVTPCKLRLSPAEEVGDEVSLTTHMDMAFMGAAAQTLIQGSAITLLLSTVQLPH